MILRVFPFTKPFRLRFHNGETKNSRWHLVLRKQSIFSAHISKLGENWNIGRKLKLRYHEYAVNYHVKLVFTTLAWHDGWPFRCSFFKCRFELLNLYGPFEIEQRTSKHHLDLECDSNFELAAFDILFLNWLRYFFLVVYSECMTWWNLDRQSLDLSEFKFGATKNRRKPIYVDGYKATNMMQ